MTEANELLKAVVEELFIDVVEELFIDVGIWPVPQVGWKVQSE